MADPYAIRNSKGTTVATIRTGAKDKTSTSLVLHGRGAPEYGLDRDQNLVFLLENFSKSTPPSNPIDGQLWWKRGVELFIFDDQAGSSGEFVTVVSPPLDLGFIVEAGDGLIGGGFPTASPLQTTLNVGEGTGITVTADLVSTNDSEIVHDDLSGFVADEHIDHSLVMIGAGAGLFMGSPFDFPTPAVGQDLRPITGGNIFIHIAAGDGLQLIPGSPIFGSQISIDDTVVTTDAPGAGSPIQVVGGIKTFGERTWGDATAIASEPSYTFGSPDGTGIFMPSPNTIGLVTGGVLRFTVDTSQRMTALTADYEGLVTEDDDIPNKKYVDDALVSGAAPTSNNTEAGGNGFALPGISSLTGLDGTQTYLVTAYGVLPHKGLAINQLDQFIIRSGTTLGLGTELAFGATAVNIDWFDGGGPTHQSIIVPMAGFTELNCVVSRGGGISGPAGDTWGSTYLNAVQLTNN